MPIPSKIHGANPLTTSSHLPKKVDGAYSTPVHYPNLDKNYARPTLKVYTIFLFAIEQSAKAQPPRRTTTRARATGVAHLPVRAPVAVCWGG